MSHHPWTVHAVFAPASGEDAGSYGQKISTLFDFFQLRSYDKCVSYQAAGRLAASAGKAAVTETIASWSNASDLFNSSRPVHMPDSYLLGYKGVLCSQPHILTPSECWIRVPNIQNSQCSFRLKYREGTQPHGFWTLLCLVPNTSRKHKVVQAWKAFLAIGDWTILGAYRLFDLIRVDASWWLVPRSPSYQRKELYKVDGGIWPLCLLSKFNFTVVV